MLDALRLTLCRLRRHATYHDLAEDFGVGCTTAWEYHQSMVAFLADLLGCADADLSVLVAGKVCLVDGSLVPTLNWRYRTDLFSGKHHRYGINIQLLVDLHGRIIEVSRAFPGSWHDMHCFREAGWVELVARCGGGIADLGYEGAPQMWIPVKKRAGVDLAAAERALNTRFAKIRVAVKWGVAHAKNWRILCARYRSDLIRINTCIQAVIGLQKLNEQFAERRLTFDRIKAAVSE